jgi:predicted nucleic acid-binding protein
LIFVVDASIAVLWFIEEADHQRAIALAENGNRLIAPDLIFPEVANVLRRKVRSGQISHRQATISIKNLNEAFQHIVPSELLIEDAFNMAKQIDHSVYDAVYLACAFREPGSFLVTIDEKFRQKAMNAGFGDKILSLDAAYTRLVTGQENDNG